ncbi:MAG: glutaredoxin [Leptospirales bacterium]|nr:glutaredoxin [Leptospirales bacterium]
MEMKQVAAALCLFVALASCQSAAARFSRDNQIDVYGRHGCGFCQEMVRNLEQSALAYRFFDIDESESRRREMWQLVRQTDPTVESFHLPVMRVNGAVLIGPEWSAVEALLKPAPRPATAEQAEEDDFDPDYNANPNSR